jgi:Sap, sulfolipid-1-addressing protein
VCSAVLVLALVAAMDPVRIGIAALLISRPRPMLNLLAFWLGGMAAGIAAPLVVLFLLRDFTLSVMRVMVTAVANPTVAQIQVAIGVTAVPITALIAARVWTRPRAPAPAGGEASVPVRKPKTPTGSNPLSIRGPLEDGSPVMAFVAGLALATPPVEYLAAITAILASGAATAAQIGAALIFTLVAFTVVEVPLISYLATPAKTLAVVQRLNDWISAHRPAIPAVVVATLAVLLVVTGMGKF